MNEAVCWFIIVCSVFSILFSIGSIAVNFRIHRELNRMEQETSQLKRVLDERYLLVPSS